MRKEQMGENVIFCGDCLQAMAEIPDRAVDGVIIDPPYSSGGTFSTQRKIDTYKKYCKAGSKFGKGKSFTGDNMDMHSLTMFLRETLKCPSARTDTKRFHKYILGKAEIRFLEGRVRFVGAPSVAPFPSMVVVWGNGVMTAG